MTATSTPKRPDPPQMPEGDGLIMQDGTQAPKGYKGLVLDTNDPKQAGSKHWLGYRKKTPEKAPKGVSK